MGHCVALDDRDREVGRADEADIVIKDHGVSRRHARFYLGEANLLTDDRDAFVEDLDSSNGVYVNGKRIEGCEQLHQGDKITLGTETILRFTYQDQIDQDFQQRLLDSAINDALTGTRNRAYFDQQFGAEFDYAARHGTVLAIILFDIDYFKQVNDTHGHLAGDAVLTQLGARLGGAVREEDFLARYGGEEFAMICRGLNAEQGFQAAERLRKTVAEKPFEYGGIEIEMTVSAGVASYPEVTAESSTELLAATDKALYLAKNSGRNRTFMAERAAAATDNSQAIGE
jgi:diguanylate cyclase (GGDEF)-like protein